MLNEVNFNYLLKELESNDCAVFVEKLEEALFAGAAVKHRVAFDKFISKSNQNQQNLL